MGSAKGAPEHSVAEREALTRITPKEGVPASAKKAIAALEHELTERNIDAKIQLGGSVAKGTNLAGDHDIDVFIRFPSGTDTETLSDLLAPAIQAAFPDAQRVHGSRDYFHILLPEGTLEIVPVLEVSTWSEASNVTDMSPLHVAYVRDHIVKRPWLAGEIRLTKQFLKSAKAYGAESYIGGFSGHVVDLLIISYGSFRALIEAASTQWNRKVVLDPEGQLIDPLGELNASKTQAPLVIVDPVQQDRNSAAALTREKFDAMRERASAYLETDEDEQAAFFLVKPLNEKAFIAEHPGKRVLRAILTPLPGKKDVVGSKCAKALAHCERAFEAHGFAIYARAWEFTTKKAIALYAAEPGLLSESTHLPGPPVHMTDAIARFAAEHETTITSEGRVHAIEPRAYRDPLILLRDALQDPYVCERVQEAHADEIASGEGE